MAPLLMAVLGGVVLSTPSAAAPLAPVAFSDLPGWERDAHEAAFATFRRSCAVAVKDPPKTRGLGVEGNRLAAICADADLILEVFENLNIKLPQQILHMRTFV